MQTEHIQVTGMTCGGCTSKVTRALKAVPGVGDVNVSLSASDAEVQYDERLTAPALLKAAVQNAGFGVGSAKAADPPPSKNHGCCS